MHARAHVSEREGEGGRGVRVDRVAFDNVPSFVFAPGLPVRAGTREVRVDVAFGGAFYAIVDAEAAGLPIAPARLPELRRVGMEIKHAVEAAITVVHPLDKGLNGIYGTIFTGPPERGDADLRNVTIFADAEVDRSPCGTGTCAVMAVVDAMGLMPPDRALRPREPHRDAVQRQDHGQDARRRASTPSCPSSRDRPGSPASTCSSSTTRTRSRGASACRSGRGLLQARELRQVHLAEHALHRLDVGVVAVDRHEEPLARR